MRTIFSKQSIVYSPQKDVTAYEMSRILELTIISDTRRDPFLYEFIAEHKIGRHFKVHGFRLE